MAKIKERADQERLGHGESTKENLAYWAKSARSHSHPDVKSTKPEDYIAKHKTITNRKG